MGQLDDILGKSVAERTLSSLEKSLRDKPMGEAYENAFFLRAMTMTKEEKQQVLDHVSWMTSPINREMFDLVKTMLRSSSWLQSRARGHLQFLAGNVPPGPALDVGSGDAVLTHMVADAFPKTMFAASDVERRLSIEWAYWFDPELFEKILNAARAICDQPGMDSYGYWHGINKPQVRGKVERDVKAQPLLGYLSGSIVDLPVENSYVSVITSFQMFHYVDDAPGFLSAVARLLKDRGTFFLHFPNPYNYGTSPSFVPVLETEIDPHTPGYETLSTIDSSPDVSGAYLQRLLVIAAANGLSLERVGRSGWLTHTKDYCDEEVYEETERYKEWVSSQEKERAELVEKCGDRFGENGPQCLDLIEVPEVVYFQFKKRGPEKVKVPYPETWLKYFDGTVVPPQYVDLDPYRCEILPSFSRKPPVAGPEPIARGR